MKVLTEGTYLRFEIHILEFSLTIINAKVAWIRTMYIISYEVILYDNCEFFKLYLFMH